MAICTITISCRIFLMRQPLLNIEMATVPGDWCTVHEIPAGLEMEEMGMLVKTKYFGEINLAEEKILEFDNGIMGFEEYTKYTILYDSEEEEKGNIMWFQSVEEPALALPVINPLYVKADYDPEVSEELLQPLGEINEENLCILLTLTVPKDVKHTTANLKAPLIVNADTRKGCQAIVENADYEVKYNVYEAIQKMKEEKGDE